MSDKETFENHFENRLLITNDFAVINCNLTLQFFVGLKRLMKIYAPVQNAAIKRRSISRNIWL